MGKENGENTKYRTGYCSNCKTVTRHRRQAKGLNKYRCTECGIWQT